MDSTAVRCASSRSSSIETRSAARPDCGRRNLFLGLDFLLFTRRSCTVGPRRRQPPRQSPPLGSTSDSVQLSLVEKVLKGPSCCEPDLLMIRMVSGLTPAE